MFYLTKQRRHLLSEIRTVFKSISVLTNNREKKRINIMIRTKRVVVENELFNKK